MSNYSGFIYNGNTTWASTSTTANVVFCEPSQTFSIAPRKRTALEALDDRVEDLCAVGRDRLAAA